MAIDLSNLNPVMAEALRGLFAAPAIIARATVDPEPIEEDPDPGATDPDDALGAFEGAV
jgi:hypothetical protein